MIRAHIPAALRRLVIERARGCCEYCLLNQDDTEAARATVELLRLNEKARLLDRQVLLNAGRYLMLGR
jgi:chorismate-pyruvate lyase